MPRLGLSVLATIAVAVLVFPAAPTDASIQTYDIFGVVTGPAASGTTVIVLGPVTQISTTNDTGNYCGRWLPAGTYRVVPSRPGHAFTPEYHNVTVGPGPGSASGMDFVSAVDTGGGPGGDPGGDPGGGPGVDPDGDEVLLHRAKVSSSGKLKIKATLRPGPGHVIRPDDALIVLLDGALVLTVPEDALVEKGSSGLTFRLKAEGTKVKLSLMATGDARLKIKRRGVTGVSARPVVRIETGSFAASAAP